MIQTFKILLVATILGLSVGCSRTTNINHTEGQEPEIKDQVISKSVAKLVNGCLQYPNEESLIKEIDEEIVPIVEEFLDMKLLEINNNVAVFEKHLYNNNYEVFHFMLTPNLKQQIDDAGIYYHQDGEILYPENLSTFSFKGILSVNVNEQTMNPYNNYITKIISIDKV